MVLQDHLSGIVDGRADSCQLHQYIGTVIPLFHHPLHLFQVTDSPGEAIDYRFLILVDMTVAVGEAVLMHIGVVVVVMIRHKFALLYRFVALYLKKRAVASL
jgi:hypothetical protein